MRGLISSGEDVLNEEEEKQEGRGGGGWRLIS
jgi:hypothetical protein